MHTYISWCCWCGNSAIFLAVADFIVIISGPRSVSWLLANPFITPVKKNHTAKQLKNILFTFSPYAVIGWKNPTASFYYHFHTENQPANFSPPCRFLTAATCLDKNIGGGGNRIIRRSSPGTGKRGSGNICGKLGQFRVYTDLVDFHRFILRRLRFTNN